VPGSDVLRLVDGDAESLDELPSTNGTPEHADEVDRKASDDGEQAEEMGVAEEGAADASSDDEVGAEDPEEQKS
jgi:hypothetical protein